MKNDKKRDCDEMNDMEKYFATKWGTPQGLFMLVVAFAIFLFAIGGFLWLLHLANVIK